jgi:hypothetical protein
VDTSDTKGQVPIVRAWGESAKHEFER